FDALVNRQAGRAETLMREHSSVVILGETLRNVLSA
ncbi:GntR family transcriptional regulator, partial [Acinetobacter baumannii]